MLNTLKIVASFIWLAGIITGLVYAAVVGNPAAQGLLFAVGCGCFLAITISTVSNVVIWHQDHKHNTNKKHH